MTRASHGSWLLRGAATVLLLFLAAPLLVLVFGLSPTRLLHGLAHPMVVPALRLTALTTACSVTIAVLLGTPLAWLASQDRGRVWSLAAGLIQLPTVLPPAVAGLALLLVFGRQGVMRWLSTDADWSPSFSTAGVVMAQLFVGAPYFVQSAVAAFRQVDPRLIELARTLGASPWRLLREVALPLARPGLVAGAIMCAARALGEFGATLMFAGNLSGRTQTLPLAIYTALESDLDAAQAMAVLMVGISVVLVLLLRTPWRLPRGSE